VAEAEAGESVRQVCQREATDAESQPLRWVFGAEDPASERADDCSTWERGEDQGIDGAVGEWSVALASRRLEWCLMRRKGCSFENCGRPHECKGLCRNHYVQQKKGKALTPCVASTVRPCGRLAPCIAQCGRESRTLRGFPTVCEMCKQRFSCRRKTINDDWRKRDD